MRTVFLLCVLLLAGSGSFAQTYYNETPEFLNANKVWAFADHAGLDFNSGTPVPIQTAIPTVPPSRPGEGSAAVSDPITGTLLFYSDGVQCWNANHELMPNGDSLHGNGGTYWGGAPSGWPTAGGTTKQGCSIVPVPVDAGKYYLFSLNYQGSNTPLGSLFYNVVDMSLDGGMGDIVAGQKNILLDSATLSEAMIAIPGNNCDVWLMVHSFEDFNPQRAYKAYHITSGGIDQEPVISYGKVNALMSTMSVSPDRTKIGLAGPLATEDQGGTEVSRFDPNTGIVFDIIEIYSGALFGASTCAFSPDNTKLYFNHSGANTFNIELTQYDISIFDSSSIASSQEIIGPTNHGVRFRLYNGIIYMAGGATSGTPIGVINQPNNAGISCDYQENAISLLPGTFLASYNLPTEVVIPGLPDTSTQLALDTSLCAGSAGIILEPIVEVPEGYTYTWTDGSTAPVKTIYEPGNYWVRYSDGCHTYIDSFHIADGMPVEPVITVNVFELGTTLSYDSYQWLYEGDMIAGATGSSYTVSQNGDYQVVVSNAAGCTDTSAIYTVSNVGIREQHPLAIQVSVYPNPAQDIVHVQSPVPVRLRLGGLEGKVLRETDVRNSLSLKGISAGMYLLEIRDQEGYLIKTVKLVKE